MTAPPQDPSLTILSPKCRYLQSVSLIALFLPPCTLSLACVSNLLDMEGPPDSEGLETPNIPD